MKVNQAKKRLGPRIQAEALDVTKVVVIFLKAIRHVFDWVMIRILRIGNLNGC